MYKERLKKRNIVSAIIALIGVIIIAIAKTDLMSGFGAGFLMVGLLRILKNYRIMKNPEMLSKMEIAETDERNIMIWTKARSLATTLFVILSGISACVLFMLDMAREAYVICVCLAGFTLIYWICYFIIRKKY